MIEPVIIVTNNPMSKEKLSEYKIDYIEGNTMNVFEKVRDYVHKGHKLLTHPLMSSIKPNETPYRTIIISKNNEKVVDIQSLNYIEEGICSTWKFTKSFGIPKWDEKVLEDFQLIDYDLIYNVFN